MWKKLLNDRKLHAAKAYFPENEVIHAYNNEERKKSSRTFSLEFLSEQKNGKDIVAT